MKTRTGLHSARLAAAHHEPSPLTALRDVLATAFAADIAAVTPLVLEVIGDEAKAARTAESRSLFSSTHYALTHCAGALALDMARAVRTRFDARLGMGGAGLSKTSRFSLADLALVEEAQLKLDIALDTCALRLKDQCATPLFKLTVRVCDLLGREAIPDAGNPVHPRVFARALLDALEELGFPLSSRLVVFEAYGPALLHIGPDLYEQANAMLARRGVLTGFNAAYGRPTARDASVAKTAKALDPRGLTQILDRLMNGSSTAHSMDSMSAV